NQLIAVNEAIGFIVANPLAGEQKIGDLSWLRVYKFRSLNQSMLLGYSICKEQIALTLVDIGSHENFYRDLKK
ncbi:MAG: type II toxin-antitoxin system RelE/ParE family toxin, partial [Holosporaceae bacterium]|nr:type II toxin-antitoxin system RelE/ParE family toxin [Holosporaceae bacterium]